MGRLAHGGYVNIKLAVAIMAVPEREAEVRAIQRDLGVPAMVVWENGDQAYGKPWGTARRGWAWLAGQPATHGLLLQDDIALCRDFYRTAVRLVRLRPEACLSLFSPRGKPSEDAAARRVSWYARNSGPWGQAILMPVPWIQEFLSWEQATINPQYRHDDSRVGFWLGTKRRPTYYTVPSLVQHVGHARSVAGNPRWVPSIGERTASVTLSPGVSGLSVDWTAGLHDPVPSGGWSVPEKKALR